MKKRLRDHFIPHKGNDYKPHSVRVPVVIALVGVAIIISLATLLFSSRASRIPFLAQVQKALLVDMTNDERAAYNLVSLRRDPLLEQAAEMKAKDMFALQYFAHTSPRGVEPWHWFKKSGYIYKYAGENLAVDFYDTNTVLEAWMNSPGHRKNILNGKYTDIGIAIEEGYFKGQHVAIVVEMFGSRPSWQPTVSPAAVPDTGNNDELEKILIMDVATNVAPEVLGVDDISLGFDIVNQLDLQAQATGDFIEFEASEDEIVAAQDPSAIKKALARPSSTAQIVILFIAGLLLLSLFMKLVIEIRKQHYFNILLVVIGILIVFGLYTLLGSKIQSVDIGDAAADETPILSGEKLDFAL